MTTRPSQNYTLTWGTTTWPSWNYVLALRHHHITLVELRPDLEAPPWTLTSRFMELGPISEAPLWTPPRRAHGIMSIWSGTTTSPCYKGHGITSYTNLTHTLSTNHEVPMHTINMSFSINDQPSIISHDKLITNSLVPTHNIHSTCISTPFI